MPLPPWTKLATDIFHFEGVSYLLMVDYTSIFPIVCKLSSVTAPHVAGHFKLIFSEYGWPNTLVSDNGPCYKAKVFTNPMQEYSVNHITGSPHFPQSDGLPEKFVQIVKNLFYKTIKEETDLHKNFDLSQHPVIKQLAISNADVTKLVHMIITSAWTAWLISITA